MKAIIPLAFYLSLFGFSPGAIGADKFLVNLRALEVSLAPASNQLGRITFKSRASGESYTFEVTYPNRSATQSSFYISGYGAKVQDWGNIATNVDATFDVGYGPFGLETGQIKVVRGMGNAVGSYQLTGTPIGTVAGQFGVVRFNGILQSEGAGAFSGQLEGQDNAPWAPQVMGLGGASSSDFVGTETGIKYRVDMSQGRITLYRSDYATGLNSWEILAGSYAKLVTSDITLTVQTSSTAAGPWTNLTSVPLTIDSAYAFFRVLIEKRPLP